MADIEIHDGGCLCGAVRYRLVGGPRHSNVCHCSQCRRQTGALVPAFYTYPLDRFALTAGSPATYRSSAKAVRQFCAACGSTLFWYRDGADELDVFAGTLDHPAALPPPLEQLWTEERLDWVLELHAIPAWRRGRGQS